jgi:hypothetical protein
MQNIVKWEQGEIYDDSCVNGRRNLGPFFGEPVELLGHKNLIINSFFFYFSSCVASRLRRSDGFRYSAKENKVDNLSLYGLNENEQQYFSLFRGLRP